MILVFAILALTIVLAIHYFLFLSLKKLENREYSPCKIIPISVIICAKNEIDNLKEHLLHWLNQNYDKYEVIIVNDASTDDSEAWLNEQAKKYPLLKVIHITKNENRTLKGKRHALHKGIEEAKYEHVVFTDADCYPASNNWLSEMNIGFNQKDVVLGYSPYQKKKGLLNLLIQYDTFLTALQYFSWANKGAPYMGVGRNIGYKKSLLTSKVFIESNKSVGGDDDLMVAQIANVENTFCLLSTNSFVISKPETKYKNWENQKTRHYSAGVQYTFSNKIIAGMFPISNILWYATFITTLVYLAFFNSHSLSEILLPILLFSYLMKSILYLYVSFRLSNIFKLTFSIFYCYVILDLIYWTLFVFFQIKHIFKAQNGWSTKKN